MFYDVGQIANEPNAIGVFASGDCLIQGIIMVLYFKGDFPISGSLREKLSVYIIFLKIDHFQTCNYLYRFYTFCLDICWVF